LFLPRESNYLLYSKFRGNVGYQQMFQPNESDGGIIVANLVTGNDGSTPIDMTLNRKLVPRAISKNGGYWQSDEDSSL